MAPVFRLTIGVAAVATVAAVVLRIVEPFEHGTWLVAYLLLAGTVAQFLLAWGQTLLAPATEVRWNRSQAALWMLGVVMVPAGVLLDIRLLVAVGSVALLVALYLFWQATRAGISRNPGRVGAGPRVLYVELLVFMALSVIIGVVLTSDVPWF